MKPRATKDTNVEIREQDPHLEGKAECMKKSLSASREQLVAMEISSIPEEEKVS